MPKRIIRLNKRELFSEAQTVALAGCGRNFMCPNGDGEICGKCNQRIITLLLRALR